MMHEEVVDQVRKLELRNGDCVVITSDRPISQDTRHRIGSGMRKVLESLGLDAPVVVLDAGLDVSILRTSDMEKPDDA